MPQRPKTFSSTIPNFKQKDNRPSAYARGYDKRWAKIRQRILVRDLYTCQSCGEMLGGKGELHVDHIRPRADGGTDEEWNLQTLCFRCHSRKTAAADNGFGNRGK
jgi:5-methylcytosine-specific restriction protein A